MANVLIVGGAEEAQLILRGLLRLHQHRILGTGLPATTTLEMLRSTPDPVLILDADCKDPVWTDFVPAARQSNPTTRVVLLSPSRSVRLDAQAHAIGVDALVRRPFAVQDLLNAVAPAAGAPSSAPPTPPAPPPPPSEGPPGTT